MKSHPVLPQVAPLVRADPLMPGQGVPLVNLGGLDTRAKVILLTGAGALLLRVDLPMATVQVDMDLDLHIVVQVLMVVLAMEDHQHLDREHHPAIRGDLATQALGTLLMEALEVLHLAVLPTVRLQGVMALLQAVEAPQAVLGTADQVLMGLLLTAQTDLGCLPEVRGALAPPMQDPLQIKRWVAMVGLVVREALHLAPQVVHPNPQTLLDLPPLQAPHQAPSVRDHPRIYKSCRTPSTRWRSAA